ncbi:hypothetical protein CHU95_17385 [Niveispirillum lacus]|uniref:Uncharacterized protein n=1 Tax=Niveispirillum lacus TaxID=1981099 RepID=A0A255YV68_9PROT|nr:hypothetical protein [Niveispirillum lacus]OYQ32555.1 hypothetical protein CHU95_17385 [Niveispirillum lacus]
MLRGYYKGLALFLVLVAGPAFADEVAPSTKSLETCIDSRRINGWTSENDRVLIVTLGAKQRYRIQLSPSARVFSVSSQTTLAFVPRSDGSLCRGWGHVSVEGQRIPILSITRLADPLPTGEKLAEPEK